MSSSLQLGLFDRRPQTTETPESLTRERIFLGTSGFSYKDWVGPFYPARTKPSEMLRYYASEFNCVEINSTFYGIPPAERTLGFLRSTPEHFVFVVKANQEMTHEVEPTRKAFDDFKRCLAPLQRAGRLGCVIAQFPQRFHRTQEAMDYLQEFRERMAEYCVVVEFRHASWNEPETFEFLNELNFHFCCVDEPKLAGLMPAVRAVTGDRCPFGAAAYIRFHGRNARQWHQHEEAWMRYNYLYSEEELRPWSDWLRQVRGSARSDPRIFTLFNNHAQAKAVEDARRLRRLLGYS